jgi:BolA-like protein 1
VRFSSQSPFQTRFKIIFFPRHPLLSHPPSLPHHPQSSSKLTHALHPTSITLNNESHKHAGHSGNPTGAPDAETHFRLDIVSDQFEGNSLVQRHRQIYGLLEAEFAAGLHALAIKAKTPSEVTK